MRAREGDLIKTSDNLIFDVKGLVHPPDKIVAFPRYIPDPTGTRGKPGEMYTKVYNLAERFIYLQKMAPLLIVGDPVFGERICEVPINQVTKHYDPIKTLAKLRKADKLKQLERKVVMLAEELHDASGISWNSIGISGSVMAGLFTLQSDIDPLVYGSKNSRRAYASLQTMLKTKTSRFKTYTKPELGALFDFRSKDTIMTFEDFEQVETRKAFQGKYDGTDYFVRFVKDWKETTEQYGDICYQNVGYAKIAATIADESEALFTPCKYKLENVKVLLGPKLENIEEVASFRGRFCEQAEPGENVLVQGKVENVTDRRQNRSYHRIIIGNQPADFMALSKL